MTLTPLAQEETTTVFPALEYREELPVREVQQVDLEGHQGRLQEESPLEERIEKATRMLPPQNLNLIQQRRMT